MKTKGIFCLEGIWDSDLSQPSTVSPILELLRLNMKIPYIHKDFATEEELEYYLKKWVQKRYSKYPILYLACHGKKSALQLDRSTYGLDQIADHLEGQCRNRIIVFASCCTLGVDKRHIKRFLKRTGALAVCGYKFYVDWLKSTAFELLLLSAMQDNEFSGRGIRAIEERVHSISRLFKGIDFRLEHIFDK